MILACVHCAKNKQDGTIEDATQEGWVDLVALNYEATTIPKTYTHLGICPECVKKDGYWTFEDEGEF